MAETVGGRGDGHVEYIHEPATESEERAPHDPRHPVLVMQLPG